MMKVDVCFKLEKKNLYIAQILVEYEGDFIFYVCSDDEKNYYIVLCTDVDEAKYVIVKTCLKNILSMLHGKMTMRGIILAESEYWDILAADDVNDDIVTKKSMKQIDVQILPYKDSCYKVATAEVQIFLQKIESDLYSDNGWSVGTRYTEPKYDYILANNVLMQTQMCSIGIEQYIQLYDKTITSNAIKYKREIIIEESSYKEIFTKSVSESNYDNCELQIDIEVNIEKNIEKNMEPDIAAAA